MSSPRSVLRACLLTFRSDSFSFFSLLSSQEAICLHMRSISQLSNTDMISPRSTGTNSPRRAATRTEGPPPSCIATQSASCSRSMPVPVPATGAQLLAPAMVTLRLQLRLQLLAPALPLPPRPRRRRQGGARITMLPRLPRTLLPRMLLPATRTTPLQQLKLLRRMKMSLRPLSPSVSARRLRKRLRRRVAVRKPLLLKTTLMTLVRLLPSTCCLFLFNFPFLSICP